MRDRCWYRLRAARKTAELLLYQEIGLGGQSSKALFERLDALGTLEEITVRINSPGGDVFEALAMHNALARHPARIVAYVDALCASAATLVALAADEVRMADNALWMVHEPWTVATGNAADLLKQSDLLDTVADQIVTIYARRTGMTPAAIREWMRAETWFTAAEALAAGFVDAIDEPLRIAALTRHPLHQFSNAPQETPMSEELPTLAVDPTPEPAPTPDPLPEPAEELAATPAEPTAEAPLGALALFQMCQSAQEMGLVEGLLAAPHTLSQVNARLEEVRAVRKICAVAKTPELVEVFIKSALTPEAAALAALNYLAERQEKTAIDSAPPAAAPKSLSRKQFNQLSPAAQSQAVKSGISITD